MRQLNMIIDWFCFFLLLAGFAYALKTGIKQFFGTKTILILNAVVFGYLVFAFTLQKDFYAGFAHLKFGDREKAEVYLNKYLHERPQSKLLRVLSHYDNGYHIGRKALEGINSIK